jgi:hypothetical protein
VRLRLALTVAAGALAAGAPAAGATHAHAGKCAPARAGAGYSAAVMRALRAREDVWGNALLRSPAGPTFAGVRRRLEPLFLARAARGARMTASGAYYLPFAQPPGAGGAGSVALHVADGSQVLAQRVDGRALTVFVGRGGERYGSCLARLAPARLAEGYLPILQTRYVDAAGSRYEQESFAARVPGARSLVSFVRLRVTARAPTRVHFEARGSSVTYGVPRGTSRTVYVTWLNGPGARRVLEGRAESYDAARQEIVAYWERRLAEGSSIVVPERRVTDAARALLIQNLELTWRYSIGNAYEEFSFPESVDVAQVMGELGFGPVARAILRTSLTRRATPYPNWKMGEKLLGWASYYRLYRDGAALARVNPVLRRYVDTLARQLTRGGILGRERYSSDIPDSVYGLHAQAVVWQGLNAIADAWAQTGDAAAAARARALAARLQRGLRSAVARSQRRLPDGSLFVPVRLLDGERPYASVTETRLGSYWNLVMPYALASGFFAPDGPQARGILRYMLRHGSRLLGLVRAGGYALYGDPVYPVSATDQVYGINVARFLADVGEPDQLVLSLYGQLAAAMAPGTFVAGEAASVAPLAGERRRSMYLPPNAASNAAFLETLRLMLVHETRDRSGRPRGLELAFATPRAWLRPGAQLSVARVPTSFGPVSYTLAADADAVHATVIVPDRSPLRSLRLRLRLPHGGRIVSVQFGGAPYDRFDARTGTIDLTGRRGTIDLDVAVKS